MASWRTKDSNMYIHTYIYILQQSAKRSKIGKNSKAVALRLNQCYKDPGVCAIRHRQMPNTFNFRSISLREKVLDALRGINPHKATGFDGWSPRMLKLVADEISEPLTVVFNQVIQEREWPKEWKRGEWVPVYKKEDPQNVANYRPVTLLPAVDKIFE